MENLEGNQTAAGGGTKKSEDGTEDGVAPEVTSKKAIKIVNRVRDKLTGKCATDFGFLLPCTVQGFCIVD